MAYVRLFLSVGLAVLLLHHRCGEKTIDARVMTERGRDVTPRDGAQTTVAAIRTGAMIAQRRRWRQIGNGPWTFSLGAQFAFLEKRIMGRGISPILCLLTFFFLFQSFHDVQGQLQCGPHSVNFCN